MKKISIVFLILIGIGVFIFFYKSQYNDLGTKQISFDSSMWKDEKLIEEQQIRKQMIADLTKNYLNESFSQRNILDLLGEPTKTDKFSEFDYVYWLGYDDYIDSHWLGIQIEDGETSWKLLRD
ncbi:MAG: hypothetical protein QG585_573 [Patescibacteria group bacterium]|jgi:hypothetical protein|nr:hypothetical protein [Patescibacteria group bacterium]